MIFRSSLSLGLCLLLIRSVEAASVEGELKEAVGRLVSSHEGDVGLAIKIFDEQMQVIGKLSIDGDKPLPTASLIKFPVMIEAYRQFTTGDLSPEKTLTLTDADKVPGSGILTEHFSSGMTLPLRDAIRLMIRYSDNTATNLVVDAIGLGSTAKTMRDMGFAETQLHSKVYRGDTSIAPERSKRFGLGSTTANTMITLLESLAKGQLISPEASDEMLDHLKSCSDATKLGRFLPSEATLAHKTGAVTKVRTDAGLITFGGYRIAICVLTAENKDRSWGADNAAEILCGRIAKAAIEALPHTTDAQEPKQLRQGATGLLVESLQRTLNKRHKADLSIDGDYGPATEAAVKSFQTANGLEATGIVSSETWAAIGDLLTTEEPIADPSVINAEQLPQSEPLDPAGPPAVTCRAWYILDVATGEEIGGGNAHKPLHFASTTKIMTAYVVMKYLEEHPEALDEIVTYSTRADNTMGSTSGVRAGEQLTVKETLYGLLLPSGNDASVALAEHFGDRLSAGVDGSDPVDRFVQEMNKEAKLLKLTSSHYKNTHGFTEEGHLSSARDLAVLGQAALQLPLFRKIVSTRRRGCRLHSVDGYSRNVLWNNSNRLLGQEGFSGIKTGTTSAAGACLVSLGTIDGVERIVVVLEVLALPTGMLTPEICTRGQQGLTERISC